MFIQTGRVRQMNRAAYRAVTLSSSVSRQLFVNELQCETFFEVSHCPGLDPAEHHQ